MLSESQLPWAWKNQLLASLPKSMFYDNNLVAWNQLSEVFIKDIGRYYKSGLFVINREPLINLPAHHCIYEYSTEAWASLVISLLIYIFQFF